MLQCSEARLREMAENSGHLMNRILFLKPEQRESEIQNEVGRLRPEVMPEAAGWHQWRSQMRSRIEARFEASYRRWQADGSSVFEIGESQRERWQNHRNRSRSILTGKYPWS